MAASALPSSGLVPNLTPLETSRSIRKSLISPQPSPSRGKKCTTAADLLNVSQSKTAGGDICVQWTSRLSWFICFVLVTLFTVFILGTHPLFNDSKTLLFCSSAPPSSSSFRADEHSSVGFHSSQDNKFGGDDVGSEKVDEKCWSRTRHWMYRPSERRFPPSPSLTRALDEYEHFHARCTAGKNWESFEEVTKSGSSQDPCKYLVYIEGIEGLGNRFLSLVSAFAYALITNRVLLLDSRRNMSSLICEPFQGSSWNLPTTFPFEKVEELPSLDDILDIVELEKMTAMKLNLLHSQTERDQRFFSVDVQERLRNLNFIAWESNQYYVPSLFTIPEFWQKLNPLFEDPSLVFTQLSRIFLLPHNFIWARTERLYRAYLASPGKLLGVQLRTDRFLSFEQQILNRVMECLTSYQMIPKLNEQILNFTSFTPNVPEEGTAILVASLRREYYEQLMELYAERGAEDGSVVTVHTMAAPGVQGDSLDQAAKAFIDMLLLSFSDSLLTSGHSTFGYVAQGFGAIVPHIVNTRIDIPGYNCTIGQSFEPCEHEPFPYDRPVTNMTDDPEHLQWIEKHIRPCPDRPWGIQLV